MATEASPLESWICSTMSGVSLDFFFKVKFNKRFRRLSFCFSFAAPVAFDRKKKGTSFELPVKCEHFVYEMNLLQQSETRTSSRWTLSASFQGSGLSDQGLQVVLALVDHP